MDVALLSICRALGTTNHLCPLPLVMIALFFAAGSLSLWPVNWLWYSLSSLPFFSLNINPFLRSIQMRCGELDITNFAVDHRFLRSRQVVWILFPWLNIIKNLHWNFILSNINIFIDMHCCHLYNSLLAYFYHTFSMCVDLTSVS